MGMMMVIVILESYQSYDAGDHILIVCHGSCLTYGRFHIVQIFRFLSSAESVMPRTKHDLNAGKSQESLSVSGP